MSASDPMFLHPDEIRRYRHFRRTFAAELYHALAMQRHGMNGSADVERALFDLATDKTPPRPSDFSDKSPAKADASDC